MWFNRKFSRPAEQPAAHSPAKPPVLHAAKLREPPHWPVMLRAAVVGLLTGFIGTALQLGTRVVARSRHNLTALVRDIPVLNWFFPMALSAVMVLGALWLVRLAPEAAGSGIQEIEGALEKRRGVNWRRVLAH